MDINEEINARFVKGNKTTVKLACCYCKAIYTGADISEFTTCDNGKQAKLDIPLCPNCFVDKIVYYSKLIGKTEDEKMSQLDELHEYWFNSTNNDASEKLESENEDELYIINDSSDSEVIDITSYNSDEKSKSKYTESESENYGFNESYNNSGDSDSEDKIGFNETSYIDDNDEKN